MKIPTILKGDDAGAITLALDSSHSYDGATLVVAYQGVTKTFTGLAAGGTVSLVYNHAETAAFRLGCYPMEARLIGAGGSVETVSNAEWRIKVTDIVSEVNCGGSFAVVPGAASVPVTDVEELGGRYKLTDLAAKINEVCRILAQRTAPVSGPSAGPFGAVALALLFSLGAFAANVQTARLDDMYNDERVVTNVTFEGLATPGAVSNIVTKAYVEDLGITADFSTNNTTLVETIEATAPAPGDYAAVSNRAMNAVQSESDPCFREWADAHLVNGGAMVDWASDAMYAQYLGDAAAPVKYSASDITSATNDLWQATALQDDAIDEKQDKLPYPTNAIPYAAISGKPNLATVATSGSYNDLSNKPTIPTVPTNVSAFNNDAGYLTGYTESDPTIKSWAKANTKPTYTASEVGAATVEDVYRIVAGTNVILVVTNYNSAVHTPAMKLQHLDPESGQYVTYWDEQRRHGMTLTNAMDYTDAAIQTRAAPRAWSGTTSGLGSEAPAGVTWISTPETVIAGGYEYEKVITSAGAVWVLSSNGLTTGATTNSFFRISASDGTELFSIEKTDSYLIGVSADAITRSGNTVTIPVNIVAGTHPYIRATTNLVNAVWVKEDENGFSCPWATVSWSGTTGAYVATVTCSQPQAFFYFEYTVEGVAKIKNTAKTEMSGGIIFNGTTYMPTVNGNKLEFVAQ